MKKIEKIVDPSGILLTKDAKTEGVTKYDLYSYIAENGFEQIGHGIYASPRVWKDDQYILHLRCPQGIFSHDEALYYHGLIDREPMRQTITIYTGYRTARLAKDGIKVFTVKKELLNVGKVVVNNSFGHSVPIYDQERTICDLVRSRSQFEVQDFQTALRTYVRKMEKDLNKLMDYARLFHVERKIREYMEVML